MNDVPNARDPGGVHRLARDLTRGLSRPEDRAAALFRFVRDEILYGFTARFDAATPEETLQLGRGHCIPKAGLFIALLREVGVRARARVVTIDGHILEGVFPAFGPARLSHSFTEVELGGRWLGVDAYCVDRALYFGARRRLSSMSKRMGFGVHLDGEHEWAGRAPAMGQLASPSMVVRDLGTFDDPADFVRHTASDHGLSRVGAGLYRVFGAPAANRTLDRLRLDAVRRPVLGRPRALIGALWPMRPSSSLELAGR